MYGGALLNPWFDRDLSIAGRVAYETETDTLAHALIDFREPVAIIPSLAIHLDREANANRSINAQTYLPPLAGQSGARRFRSDTQRPPRNRRPIGRPPCVGP